MKKIIALILAISLLGLTALTACGGDSDFEGRFTNCGLKANDVVMVINGEDVTAQEYFFLADYCYNYMNYYYGTFTDWDGYVYDDVTLRDYITADVLNSCIYYHTFGTFAADVGGVVDKDDEEAIQDDLDIYISDYFGDRATFEIALKDYYFVDEETFTLINCTVPHLYNKIFYNIYGTENYLESRGQDAVEAYIEESGTMKAAHILIKTVDENYEPLEDSVVAEKTQLAQELYQQVLDGANFYELMDQYSEDPGKETEPTGYTFNNSTSFVEEFKSGTAALAIGEYGLVESSYGYHILWRLPVDKELAAQEMCYLEFDAQVNTWCSQAEVEYTELFDKIDLSKMYE